MPFKLLKKAKKFDLFGRQPTLQISNASFHKTWFGLFITVIVFLICIASTAFYIDQFLKRDSPAYIYSEIQDGSKELITPDNNEDIADKMLYLKIGTSEIFVMMVISNSDNTIDINTPKLQNYEVGLEEKQVHLVQCKTIYSLNEVIQGTSFITSFITKYFDALLCLKSEQIDFIYDNGDELKLSLNCPKQSECEELDNKQLLIIGSDYLLKLSSYQNPLELSTIFHQIDIYPNQTTILDVYLQKINVNSKSGYFFETNKNDDQYILKTINSKYIYSDNFYHANNKVRLMVRLLPHPKRIVYQVIQSLLNQSIQETSINFSVWIEIISQTFDISRISWGNLEIFDGNWITHNKTILQIIYAHRISELTFHFSNQEIQKKKLKDSLSPSKQVHYLSIFI